MRSRWPLTLITWCLALACLLAVQYLGTFEGVL